MALLILGKTVEFPDHERIIIGKDIGAWWGRDEFGTGPRHGDITVIGGHWTAGEAGIKDPDGDGPRTAYDDDGPRVVSSMKARMSEKRPGERLQVSIPFVVGACDPEAEWAPIWQAMDFGYNTAVHVGDRGINRRSVAYEVVNSGAHGGPLDTRHREWFVRKMLGRKLEVATFFKGQLNSIAWLSKILTSHAEPTALGHALTEAGIRIPRQVPMRRGELLAERFTQRELSKWKGVLEHFHVTGTTKVDAALMVCEACQQRAGFVGVEV